MISKIATFALGLMMAAIQPALAARIYNYLPVPVHVRGSHEGSVTVGAGKRSESLSWPTSHMVFVFVTTRMLDTCAPLSFGLHAEMTGGHYLVIGHDGLSIFCALCDSDHNAMRSSSGRAPQEIAKELQGKSGDHSC